MNAQLDEIKERLSDADASEWFQSKFSRQDCEWLVGQLEATREALRDIEANCIAGNILPGTRLTWVWNRARAALGEES